MLWWRFRQLKSDDPVAAERAASELGASRQPQAVDPLLAALGSPHERVRHAAARALAEIGDRRAVEPLLATFRKIPTEPLARALDKFGDKRAIELLIVALIHPEESVRQHAAGLLNQLDPQWIHSESAKAAVPRFLEALHDPRHAVQGAALDLLEKMGEPGTARALIEVIEGNAGSAGWAVRALDRIHPEWTSTVGAAAAVPSLIEVLGGQGFERELAAATLAEIGDPRALDPLAEALRDRDRHLRNAAVRALGQLGDPRAIRPLLAAPLDGLLDPWVVQLALNAIDPKWASSAEANEFAPACLPKLVDRDWSLRQQAEAVLAMIDPNWPASEAARDAVPMFQQRRSDPDPAVQEAAGRVLARILG
jgi:HEAT repeat protein